MATGDRNFDAAQRAHDNLMPEDFEVRVNCSDCGVAFWMKPACADAEMLCPDCSFEPPDFD